VLLDMLLETLRSKISRRSGTGFKFQTEVVALGGWIFFQ
jgi:hypothetical protein